MNKNVTIALLIMTVAGLLMYKLIGGEHAATTDTGTKLAENNLGYAAPTCGYQIQEVNGVLVPVDAQGQRIGFFERHPDGVVQLTTATGYAPVANECIKRAGFEALIVSVRPYGKPSA